MSEPLTITLESEDWIEVVASLATKSRRIRQGDLGPEDTPGADARWVAHIEMVKAKIERVLYKKKLCR